MHCFRGYTLFCSFRGSANYPVFLNSLNADYTVAWGKSLSGLIFARSLILAMLSGEDCDSYLLDER